MFPWGKLSMPKSCQETHGHDGRTLENQDFFGKKLRVGNEMITLQEKKLQKKSTARRYISRICIDLSFFLLIRMLGEDSYLEPETSSLKWLFQFDDSKSLHKKWLFH